jgi:hypothetical protein
MRQPGYISGETLTNYADQQDLCVIATWQTMEEWLKWKEIQNEKTSRPCSKIFNRDRLRTKNISWEHLSKNKKIPPISQLAEFLIGLFYALLL